MDEQRPWHRIFAMSLTDLLTGQPVQVEMEVDLSRKLQFLDVVLIRKGPEPLTVRLPDGFEELATHNLISFKSFQETLDGWALNELVGHYVNYRKQVSPDQKTLLAEEEFRVFAVSVRFPQGLSRRVALRPIRAGVYEAEHFTGVLRVVVVHQLPLEAQNALFHLFSAQEDPVRFGAANYRPRSQDTSTFFLQLFQRYQQEGVPMPFTKEQFKRETFVELLKDEELLAEILKEEAVLERVLERVPIEDRLEGISPEDRLRGLSPEERARLLRLLSEENTADRPT